jgi:RNA polymerase sigma-70 factor (ECF subfamily)
MVAMTRELQPDLGRLLGLAREGDGSALGELFEAYRHYLTLLARIQIDNRLKGKVDPSDLVQEAFLEAQRAFKSFRGSTVEELLQWLRQILVFRLAKLVRRYYGTRCRNVRLEVELNNQLDRSSQAARELIGSQPSPSQQAAEHEQAILLANVLQELPSDYREVIVLRHMEELPFPEVAERMGRSLGSVEKLWVRALGALRPALRGATHG